MIDSVFATFVLARVDTFLDLFLTGFDRPNGTEYLARNMLLPDGRAFESSNEPPGLSQMRAR